MALRRSAPAERTRRLRERIERWRSTRTKLWPMPRSLWEEAAGLAREFGVYSISFALGLNYESLRRRVGGKGRGRGRAEARSGEFVELSGSQLLGLPAPSTGPVMEFSDGAGFRLTVRLAPGSAVDVARLVEVFRGQPA